MQNTNVYVASEEREEIANEGKAAQQLEQILASGLPPLYRRAYRILGMQLTQRMRFRMLFSLPIPICTSSEGSHRSLLGLPPSCLTALDYNYVGGQNTSKCLSTNSPGDRNQFQCRSD